MKILEILDRPMRMVESTVFDTISDLKDELYIAKQEGVVSVSLDDLLKNVGDGDLDGLVNLLNHELMDDIVGEVDEEAGTMTIRQEPADDELDAALPDMPADGEEMPPEDGEFDAEGMPPPVDDFEGGADYSESEPYDGGPPVRTSHDIVKGMANRAIG